MSPHILLEVDLLSIVPIVDNEVDSLSSRTHQPGVSVVADLHRLVKEGKHYDEETGANIVEFGDLCCGAHGLSLLITAKQAHGLSHTILFDTGPDGAVFRSNSRKLGVDFHSVDCIVLSHWHADHSGGMIDAIKACVAARKKHLEVDGSHNHTEEQHGCEIEVDVHPDYPEWRGIEVAGKVVAWNKDPSPTQMLEAGGNVHQHSKPHQICDGFFLVSGEIPRRTAYETGLSQLRWVPKSNSWEPDPLIMDERFVLVNIKGKGLVIFTGCSHAGVVNVCKHARELFPDIPLYAVVGGYHLAGHNEDRISATVEDLQSDHLNPVLLLPAHCTGWRAKNALENAFPSRVLPCSVGNKITIDSA